MNDAGELSGATAACGKRTLTAAFPVQRKPKATPAPEMTAAHPIEGRQGLTTAAATEAADPFWFASATPATGAGVQRAMETGAGEEAATAATATGEGRAEAVHRAAARGIQGAGERLPFFEEIQRGFGRHDLSRVQAHTGAEATEAARAMGATAFATGEHVVFAGTPDLHTAAHEAAHVVQQRAGLSLAGGVGAVGDQHEGHADRVADAVVAGQSAEALLDEYGGAPAARGEAAAAAAPAADAAPATAVAATQQQAVQCDGVERATTGRPSGVAPYVDAPPNSTATSIGVTTGDVVRVRVTGRVDGTLKARVTAGGQFVQVGASAEALGGECTIVDNTLFVKGVASNEELAKTGCEISILENEGKIQKLQPKVYAPIDLPIHAWKLTLSLEDGPYQGMPLYGEEMDLERVMTDVAATWRAAGIRVTLGATTAMHLKVPAGDDIAKQVEAGLKADGRFKTDDRRVHLVFVPVYERFGLTFSRYSRSEVDPTQMTKDVSRQKGFDAPMAIVGVNGYKNPAGQWGSRSKETEPIDGQERATTEDDKNFHYQSLSSDTAHELGHILSLPHVSSAPTHTLTANRTSSHLFSQLMHAQVAFPLRNMVEDDDQTNQTRLEAARLQLSTSAHPRTQLGEMRDRERGSYNTQRGAMVTDQFAQMARQHVKSGKVFSEETESEILDEQIEREMREWLRSLEDHDEDQEDLDEDEAPLGDGPMVLQGLPYQGDIDDLNQAVEDILSDGGLRDEVDTYAPEVVLVLKRTHATVKALTVAIAAVLPVGKDRLAEELAGYIAEHSGAQVQRSAGSEAPQGGVAQAAAHGTSGAGGALPFLAPIQQAFGRHDVSQVQAHTDSAAAEGAKAMGASAFASGDHVAFAGTPDLHTAAHEAAHVVQQRAGVSLASGVGQKGDAYEQHADAVADAVVAGGSAEQLLDGSLSNAAGGGVAVQHKPSDIGAFTYDRTAKLDTLGADFTGDARVVSLFNQVFPGKNIAQLPTVVGLSGILALGEDANKDTQLIATWKADGEARWEIEIKNPMFHLFLNEIRWANDSAAPAPFLFLHKWDRNADGGGPANGAGLSVFRGMHGAATTLGMNAIVADAIGSQQAAENGYYTWVRFGFNNQKTSDLENFTLRLAELHASLNSLDAQREALAVVQGALPAQSTVAALSAQDKREERRQLNNQKTLEGSLTADKQAELDYLTKAVEVLELEGLHATYRAPLNWYIDNCGQIEDLNDLFLKAPDAATRTQMATLWKGYGSTVTEAVFDLAEGSKSNQVLAHYVGGT